MSTKDDSILKSAFRSLLRTAFAVVGIFLGLFIVLVFLGGAFGSATVRPQSSVKLDIEANANGKRSDLDAKHPVILKININGAIGTELLNQRVIEQILIECQEKPLKRDLIKGIFLKINTPGGTATDSDGAYRLIKRFKEQLGIPVYAYIDGLCASGGMFITSAADKVYASKSSTIGSVGVIFMPFFNVTQAMEKVGVTSKTVSFGIDKDMFNPTRPWTPDEGKNLQAVGAAMYAQFVDIVVTARPQIDRAKLISEYGAQIYAAEEALRIGYIDEVEDDDRKALRDLVEKAGIKGDYNVVAMSPRTWVGDLFMKSPAITGKVEVNWLPGIDKRFYNQFLYLYTPGLSAEP